MPSNIDSAKDEQILGYHELPDGKQLKRMSKLRLLSMLSLYENEPIKFRYFEDELDRRKYTDIARANLPGIIIGAVIGAVATMIGHLFM